MNPVLRRALPRGRRHTIAAAGTAVVASLALHAAPALASSSQVAIIQDGTALNQNPGGVIQQFRALGASTLRVMIQWDTVAPSAKSTRAPRFDATSPGAYPSANWVQWDTIVRTATAAGMKVDLDIIGGPPRWADGSGVPGHAAAEQYGWKVNAKDYGEFVQAVGTRYDGHYRPSGASTTLPKVSLWSLWNEPNFGQNLGPQTLGATSRSPGYDVAAGYYRNMLRSGWSALQKTEHGSRILIGEFAGEGRVHNASHTFPQGLPGNYAITNPVSYIQTLYCVDSHNHALTGTAAKMADCPTSGGARASFVKDNPALFNATAVSTHPYASTFSPTEPSSKIPSGYIILPVIGRLTSELTAVTRAWHHTRNYSVWSTEYGFVTSPPQHNRSGMIYPSPTQAAIYLNEAEYLSWRNPRVASYAQYLLQDPAVLKGVGLFSSGLLTDKGVPKPTYDAYRLPFWIPDNRVSRGAEVQVWGGARPAVYAGSLSSAARQVQIQVLSGSTYRTLKTVTVNRSTGYFDTHLKLTQSGPMRLAYTYPSTELGLPPGVAGATVYSRVQKTSFK